MPSLCSLGPLLTPVAALDEERGDPRLRALVGGGGAREDVNTSAKPPLRDPDLLAVEDVAVAVAVGARLDGGGVAAGAELGEREGGERLAASRARQVLRLQLLAAEEAEAP